MKMNKNILRSILANKYCNDFKTLEKDFNELKDYHDFHEIDKDIQYIIKYGSTTEFGIKKMIPKEQEFFKQEFMEKAFTRLLNMYGPHHENTIKFAAQILYCYTNYDKSYVRLRLFDKLMTETKNIEIDERREFFELLLKNEYIERTKEFYMEITELIWDQFTSKGIK